MATINLGAIKFNWKGAYNSSTTYAVDDVVSSGGNSYVCIQAHSNQAVGNATAYWNIMSSAGTNGTNGTDVGTTLTTQGDILYRDGSGLQRLAKGTAGQVLQMNSGATAPEYGTVSSDFVKIASGSHSGTNLIMDNIFADSTTYGNYQVHINYAQIGGPLYIRGRTGGASGTTYNATEYCYRSYMRGWNSDSSDHETGEAGWNQNAFRPGYTSTTGMNGDSFRFIFPNPNNTTHRLAYSFENCFMTDTRISGAFGAGVCRRSESVAFTGLDVLDNNGSFTCKYAVYGMKA